jgi:hypothetical protein
MNGRRVSCELRTQRGHAIRKFAIHEFTIHLFSVRFVVRVGLPAASPFCDRAEHVIQRLV